MIPVHGQSDRRSVGMGRRHESAKKRQDRRRRWRERVREPARTRSQGLPEPEPKWGHEDLAKRFDLVLSIPGIGERTALALVIRMPELGQISREEAAALAGLAPFDNDSGQYRGQRKIAGGRGRLRKSLFAAALPAAFKWNKALIELYGRLRAKGKEHNLALIACARKLLIFANTVVQRGTPWVENTAG